MIAAIVCAVIGILLLFLTVNAVAHLIGWLFIAAAVVCLIVFLVGASRSRVP